MKFSVSSARNAAIDAARVDVRAACAAFAIAYNAVVNALDANALDAACDDLVAAIDAEYDAYDDLAAAIRDANALDTASVVAG